MEVVMRRFVFAVLCLLFIFSVSAAVTQEYSEKKEIAVFALSYYDWKIPGGALGSIDEEIRSVFINLGRFNVIGMTYRLGQNDINAFIQKIKEYKESNVEVPEKVLAGKAEFTEADFNRLIGSFIVVIPSVSYFNIETQEDGDYEATVRTSFTFVNVDTIDTLGQFFVETTGIDKNRNEAIQEAVDSIRTKLTYEIRKMPVFQIKTGVLEVRRGEVVLEFGNNMGVKQGDEYAIINSSVTRTGHTLEEETGLIVIKEVNREFSIGKVLYASPRVVVGDQLREVPRIGFEFSPYFDYVANNFGGNTPILGLKSVASRGFYAFRPFAGIEIPFTSILNFIFFPANVFVGGEYNLYLGRLRITPSLSVGIGGGVPLIEDPLLEDFYLTHLGGNAKLSINYLLGKNALLFAEGGYAYWYGVVDSLTGLDFFSSYGGPMFGAGVTFK
jgi:hypothetical protein